VLRISESIPPIPALIDQSLSVKSDICSRADQFSQRNQIEVLRVCVPSKVMAGVFMSSTLPTLSIFDTTNPATLWFQNLMQSINSESTISEQNNSEPTGAQPINSEQINLKPGTRMKGKPERPRLFASAAENTPEKAISFRSQYVA
jgi:hypothetical protein